MDFFTFLGLAAVSLFSILLGVLHTPKVTTFQVPKAPESPDLPSGELVIQKPNPKPMNTKLDEFCGAIRDFEGSPGNLNYKNNNPGNCRCSPVGYLPKYGEVKCVNNFAVFETYNLGWQYLENLVYHRAVLHPQWTVLDFFNNYAPSEDKNSPNVYAAYVAKRCGVETSTTLKELFG